MTSRTVRYALVAIVAAIVLIALLWITSLWAIRDVDTEELRDMVQGEAGAMSPMWTGTFYCGSDDKYHYFEYTRRLSFARRIRIPRQSLTIVDVAAADWGNRRDARAVVK